jgi:hypothetical protein
LAASNPIASIDGLTVAARAKLYFVDGGKPADGGDG